MAMTILVNEESTTFQKAVENAAGKVAHHTKAEREKYTKCALSDYVRKLLRDAKN